MGKRILIALGGNALQEAGKPATAQAQLAVVRQTADYIADIIAMGYAVILTHGNGPQVGRIVQQNEYADAITPAMPFDVCGAMSQGMIGYHIQQCLMDAMQARGLNKQAVTLLTQVVVDQQDPRFQNPSKPIGRFYTQAEAEAIQRENPDQTFKEDAGRGWRRVVPSPLPVEIVELDAIKCLVAQGFVTVAAGGGGIPVIRENGQLQGTAAVIDKDFASEKLAEAVDAEQLLILTGVDQVCVNYNKPDQKGLDRLSVAQARQYMAEGQFAPGSMLPKVEAAVRFAASKPGRETLITSLEKAVDALQGKTGTVVYA